MASGLAARIDAKRDGVGAPRKDANAPNEQTVETGQQTEAADKQADKELSSVPDAAAPADVAQYCAENGASEMAATLIREGVTMDAVKQRVDAVSQIRDAVSLAASLNPMISSTLSEKFVKAGMTVTEVRADLFGRLANMQSEETENTVVVDQIKAPSAKINHQAIYNKMNRIKE